MQQVRIFLPGTTLQALVAMQFRMVPQTSIPMAMTILSSRDDAPCHPNRVPALRVGMITTHPGKRILSSTWQIGLCLYWTLLISLLLTAITPPLPLCKIVQVISTIVLIAIPMVFTLRLKAVKATPSKGIPVNIITLVPPQVVTMTKTTTPMIGLLPHKTVKSASVISVIVPKLVA